MRLIPYKTNAADKVLEMLARHFDYTPELASAENRTSNIEYFMEAYCDEGCSGISYVFNADDESVIGFLEATERKCRKGELCWYITFLFVLEGRAADHFARYMADQSVMAFMTQMKYVPMRFLPLGKRYGSG